LEICGGKWIYKMIDKIKCLIWGTGEIFYHSINLIRYFEEKNVIQICAITGNKTMYSQIGS